MRRKKKKMDGIVWLRWDEQPDRKKMQAAAPLVLCGGGGGGGGGWRRKLIEFPFLFFLLSFFCNKLGRKGGKIV